jgi:hypothetical protein
MRRNQSNAQTCQRHDEGWAKQTLPQGSHRAFHILGKKTAEIDFSETLELNMMIHFSCSNASKKRESSVEGA